MNLEEYIQNYSQRHKIYWGGGIPWRKYKGVLCPLSHPHIEPKLGSGDIRKLLKESKAACAIWTYDFDSSKSEWWWIVAEKPYSLELLKPKTRYNIRHGLKSCAARIISGKALSDAGYDCYRSAMQRHSQTVSLDEAAFRRLMPNYDFDDAHEVWGLFMEEKMIGYAIYRIIDDIIYEEDTIFDPHYFKYHSSYVLIHTSTHHYLNERNFRYILCGWRSVSHETTFQEFTIDKFMRRKAYCQLGLEYAAIYGMGAVIVCQSKAIWSRLRLPGSIKNKLNVIYKLNQIQRHSVAQPQISEAYIP
ncbi:MAG: hypothetical protein WD688_13700 [Candidatus Binatia bacterium]